MHVRDECFMSFEGHAFLKLQSQHWLCFGCRAREFFKVLHEDADNRIRKNDGNAFVSGAQSFADISDSGFDGGAVHEVGSAARGNNHPTAHRPPAVTIPPTPATP